MLNFHDRLLLYYLYLMLDIRSFAGQSPRLFGVLQGLSPTRRIHNLVEKNTGICIEAPSGSGNSYFVNGFRMINPGIRVAHHHHVAVQVTRSVLYQVPTAIILREPVDCVVSRVAFWNAPVLIAPIFRQWIRFFRAVEQVVDRVLVVSFESVTRQPDEVIKAINEHFDTSFNSRFPEMEQIAADMDRAHARNAVGPEQRNPNLPSAEKEAAKTRFRSLVAAHRLAQPATSLYSRLAGTAV